MKNDVIAALARPSREVTQSSTPRFALLNSQSSLVLAACLTLAACGTPPRSDPPAAKAPPAAAPAIPPATPPLARGGGYYLDDGPGDNPPANLETIPDAAPRMEPLHRGALRPYTVMGRNYVPMTALAPYRARGVASWYGRRYHGKLTSNGETYNMYGMTAAHPTLPLPSYVRVTSVANGKSVVLRVNDRGPFIDSRLIDLSYTAAYKLGVIAGGSALVDVELIQAGGASATAAAPPPAAAAPAVVARQPPAPTLPPAVASSAPTAVASPAPPAVASPTPPAVASSAPPAVSTNAATPEAAVIVPAARTLPVAAEGGGVYLQLAAFGSKDNAEAYASRLRTDVAWLADQLQVMTRDGLFRVRAGPYANSGDARQTAERITQSVRVKPVIQSQ